MRIGISKTTSQVLNTSVGAVQLLYDKYQEQPLVYNLFISVTRFNAVSHMSATKDPQMHQQ